VALDSRDEKSALFAILIIKASILACFLNVVPFWDAALYLAKFINAASGKFSFFRFSRTYISPVYNFLMAFPQYLDFANSSLTIAVQITLHLIAIFAFHRILQNLNASQNLADCRLLCTSCFAFMPLGTAGSILINPDLGVLTFFLLFVLAIFRFSFVSAAVFGCCMAFTKQVGIALFVFSIPLVLFAYRHSYRGPIDRRRPQNILLLLTPLVLYAAVLFSYLFTYWHTEWLKVDGSVGLLNLALDQNFLEKSRQAYLSFIFLLNFSWVPFLVLVFACLRAILEYSQTSRVSGIPCDKRKLWMLLAWFLIAVYIVTRYPTKMHPRYVISALGPLFLLLYPATAYLFSRRLYRNLTLVSLMLLLYFSNFRSIDPISANYYR
jgi:hypothetical protein